MIIEYAGLKIHLNIEEIDYFRAMAKVEHEERMYQLKTFWIWKVKMGLMLLISDIKNYIALWKFRRTGRELGKKLDELIANNR